MKTAWIVGILMFMQLTVYAEQGEIRGRVVDNETKEILRGASVSLIGIPDSSRLGAVVSQRGNFAISGVKSGKYRLNITFIGYETHSREFTLKKDEQLNLGTINLKPLDVQLREVEVTAQAAIGEIKEDTLELSSSAFKTRSDAAVEDLVKRMPGVQVESDGTVKAQGEEVKRVLVDGRPFFGDDPSVALKNLPAEVVDRVQIYDRASDQAAFTGFDDGESQKTMNIITKPSRRKGIFGKATVGGGTDDKYMATMNVNFFDEGQRISILGMSNNINQQNFAFQDVMSMIGGGSSRGGPLGQIMRQRGGGSPGGAATQFQTARFMDRSGMSNFMVGQLDGLNKTNSIGINYNNVWEEQLEISGSYFFNMTNNSNLQEINREIFLTQDTTQFFNQNQNSATNNFNHRLNFEVKYQLDSNNSFILKPSLNFQSSNSDLFQLSNNYFIQDTISGSNNLYNSNSDAVSFSNEFVYRHRFNTSGRTISFDLRNNYNNRESNFSQLSENAFYQQRNMFIDTLNMKGLTPSDGWGSSLRTIYTEPLGEQSQLQVNYNISFNRNNSDRRIFNYNNISEQFDMLDSLLSNTFENDYLTQRAGLGYRFNNQTINFSATVDYQNARLISNQEFPISMEMNYTFENFLPRMWFNYSFSKQSNLRLFYRTSTSSPSITQLQNVIDNSNPLQLSAGNPELKQSYSHFFMTRFSNMSPTFTNIFLVFFNAGIRADNITNATYIATRDTLIDGKILLPAGGQYQVPVNMDGFWNANLFLTYGFPISFIRTNANFNLGSSFSRSPSLINDRKNFSNALNLNSRIGLNSNISKDLDFSVNAAINWNSTKNTLRQDLNNTYTNYSLNTNFYWNMFAGIFVQAELATQYYTGLQGMGDQLFSLLNLHIGKKFFENEAGELKLTLFDAFKQNKSLTANITDYYTEYTQSNVLQQYVLLSFSYNLRQFGGGGER